MKKQGWKILLSFIISIISISLKGQERKTNFQINISFKKSNFSKLYLSSGFIPEKFYEYNNQHSATNLNSKFVFEGRIKEPTPYRIIYRDKVLNEIVYSDKFFVSEGINNVVYFKISKNESTITNNFTIDISHRFSAKGEQNW